ncbi:hypothetical protein AVEN_80460-1 [Araneus ventricosus]|uniref:Uncharacterized protein n=1 Tax=Araneus ventricosus TaxID=182803 RepID=A0A4Y2H851_ARAVE|nr:hypothetical protein AVEN_80460-1 [Araneus ventricosus]
MFSALLKKRTITYTRTILGSPRNFEQRPDGNYPTTDLASPPVNLHATPASSFQKVGVRRLKEGLRELTPAVGDSAYVPSFSYSAFNVLRGKFLQRYVCSE